MLDLKAKLLAAGLVTAEQVKKVEDDESARKQKAREQREQREQQRSQPRGAPRGAPREGRRGPPRDAERRPPRKADPNDPLEKEARREHQLVEAERWRQRLTELAAAGKSDQYEAIRGWVTRWRMDSKTISDAAERFHFMRFDGNLSHLTVEPDVKEKLSQGDAALVAFMGFNGLEHAIVPKDVALDIQVVRPEWLRALVGATILEPPAPAPPAAAPEAEVASAPSAAPASDEPVSDT